MFPNRRAVILMGGGIDSATLLKLATVQLYEVHALVFDYGQVSRGDITHAHHNAKAHGAKSVKTVALDGVFVSALNGNGTGSEVPFRNLVFMSIAAAHAKAIRAGHIFMGLCRSDVEPKTSELFADTSGGFVASAAEFLDEQGIQFHAPLVDVTKSGVINLARALGVDLSKSWSCWKSTTRKPCGVCGACKQRNRGFRIADAGES